jgi:hypothetical protein
VRGRRVAAHQRRRARLASFRVRREQFAGQQTRVEQYHANRDDRYASRPQQPRASPACVDALSSLGLSENQRVARHAESRRKCVAQRAKCRHKRTVE